MLCCNYLFPFLHFLFSRHVSELSLGICVPYVNILLFSSRGKDCVLYVVAIVLH
jgi:hypothetical protein